MNNLIILLIAIFPVFVIAFYVYKKDRDKESKRLLAKLLFYGMLSCIPAVILELKVGALFGPEESMDMVTKFFYIFFSIALVEEGCKWFFVYRIAYNNHEFDHIYDAIVYSVFVSLGFALFENIFYVFLGGITTGLLRAITAVPGHAINGILMGEYLGLAKKHDLNKNNGPKRAAFFLSLFMPTLTHALYDYCLLTANMTLLVVFLFYLIYLYIYSFKTIKKVSKVPNNLRERPIIKRPISREIPNNLYCPKCKEYKRVGKYCNNCGNPLIKINN